jgi:hypothetical protein
MVVRVLLAEQAQPGEDQVTGVVDALEGKQLACPA